jgi:transketolase
LIVQILPHTVLGKGISYMEGKIKWHYWPMSDAEFEQSIEEIEKEK